MTQKDKELLLKDLCARLPYGVKVKLLCRGPEPKFDDWIEDTLNTRDVELFGKSFKKIQPYLRPMSSMTEEEVAEFESITDELLEHSTSEEIWNTVIDWLNAHHFDHRHLIEKGLALEAPEGMYNIKTE